MNLILCGPPLTGKTTLGQLTAQKLQWSFKDTDHLIEEFYATENHLKLSCREIHRKEGEERFRFYESKVVETLVCSQNCVIALGGGCLNQASNVKILKNLGLILYIKTSLVTLQKRLMSAPLPSYLEKEKDPLKAYERLINRRSSIYEACANKMIETDLLTETQIISIICGCIYGE